MSISMDAVLPKGERYTTNLKEISQTEKTLKFANTKTPWLRLYRKMYMIIILLVCLHSVAIQREAADAALVPNTDELFA